MMILLSLEHIYGNETSLSFRFIYLGEINNCLDFVLRFLHLLNSSPSSGKATPSSGPTKPSNNSSHRESDRLDFTRRRLLPLMESSLKYISLYRKLVQTGVWIHEDSPNAKSGRL